MNLELEYRFECGYNKALKFSEKEDFIRTIWLHFVFYLSQSELEKFQNGFVETLGMDELIVLHPGIVWDCLIKTDCFNVTANFLLDSYVAIFSDVGSNNREAEEAIIVNWSKPLVFATVSRETLRQQKCRER